MPSKPETTQKQTKSAHSSPNLERRFVPKPPQGLASQIPINSVKEEIAAPGQGRTRRSKRSSKEEGRTTMAKCQTINDQPNNFSPNYLHRTSQNTLRKSSWDQTWNSGSPRGYRHNFNKLYYSNDDADYTESNFFTVVAKGNIIHDESLNESDGTQSTKSSRSGGDSPKHNNSSTILERFATPVVNIGPSTKAISLPNFLQAL